MIMFYLIVVRLWHVTQFVFNFFVDIGAGCWGHIHISRRSASGEQSEIRELGQRLLFVSVA